MISLIFFLFLFFTLFLCILSHSFPFSIIKNKKLLNISGGQISTNSTSLFSNESLLKQSNSLLVKDLFLNNYDSLVMKAKNPILIIFHANWCQPCKYLYPILKNEILQQNTIQLCSVDMSSPSPDERELSNLFEVKGFPTVFLVHNNKVLYSFSGARQPNDVKNLIKTIQNNIESYTVDKNLSLKIKNYFSFKSFNTKKKNLLKKKILDILKLDSTYVLNNKNKKMLSPSVQYVLKILHNAQNNFYVSLQSYFLLNSDSLS